MGNTWKIVLATVVIFGAGVITGGMLVSYSNHAKPVRVRRPNELSVPLWPNPRGVIQGRAPELQSALAQQRADFVLGVARELDLTPEQRSRIERIVREGQERTRAIWQKAAPELRREMEEVRESIRAELTPEQRARFEKLLKQHQRRQSEESPAGPRSPRESRPLPLLRPPPAEPNR